MKKRILSMLMCLCLTATLFPAGAFATGDTKADSDEASVTVGETTTYYATIEEAWSAATTAENVTATVTLLKNAEITETGNTDNASLRVTKGKTITFTGEDGATLTSNARDVFNVNGGTLNIIGGAVTGTHGTASTSGCVISVNSAGTANISGGTLTASGDSATTVSVYSNREAENSSATISGTAVIKATGNRGCGVFCSANNNDNTAIVNIQGGTIESTGGELSSGVSASAKGKINITGGSIKSTFYGVDLANGGVADISNGTIEVNCSGGTARPEGVCAQSGSEVTISGGTITVNNAGNNIRGIGVTIRNINGGIPHGTISGGTISGPIGVEAEQGGVLTITGGNITGTKEGGLIVTEYGTPGKATLSGGTFTGSSPTSSAIAFKTSDPNTNSTNSLTDLLKIEEGKTYAYFKNDAQIPSSQLKKSVLSSTITVKDGGKKDAGLTITPTVSNGTVTLTVAVTPESLLSNVTVTGTKQEGEEAIDLTAGEGTWSYTLPQNATADDVYTFTATFAGGDEYIGDRVTCSVKGDGTIVDDDPGDSVIYVPTFSPGEGTYSSAQTVTLTATQGAQICYTLDGTDPYTCEESSRHWYDGPITISSTTTVKAGAIIYEGQNVVASSPIATIVYTIAGGGNGGGGSSRPSGGSSSSGGTTTSKPVTNPDGSTTTKTENKTTGTVTETTKAPDGSQTVVETQKNGTVTTTATDKDGNKTETVAQADGSSVTKVEQKDGTTANVTIDTAGKTQAEVKVPAAVAQAAQQSGKALALPIPAVRARTVRADAPEVTVSTGSSTPVKVEIPTANPTPGTVAVLVNANGTEEVIKTSLPTDGGVAVSLPDGATVKIVDNSKTFADVPAENWAADAVRFSSARELFGGTGENSFSPNAPMTRAMMVTVLARFDGADTNGGDTWYEKGVDWAVEKGISDGSAPESSVTREQLAVMLWRYAGSPAPAGSLEGFSDAESVSDYAQEAMRWAVENGIVNGFGDGQLGPQGQATRAQVAQMLKNFIEKA